MKGDFVYSRRGAYLQRPAAEALARATRRLHAQGFGIVVFDAYRPSFVTKMFWDGTPQLPTCSSRTPVKALGTIAEQRSTSAS
jgi:D-alanyl-D-alanine dipeptidase